MQPLNDLTTIITRLVSVGCSNKRFRKLKRFLRDQSLIFPKFPSRTRWGLWMEFVEGLAPIWNQVKIFFQNETSSSSRYDEMLRLFDCPIVAEMVQHVIAISPILQRIRFISQSWPISDVSGILSKIEALQELLSYETFLEYFRPVQTAHEIDVLFHKWSKRIQSMSDHLNVLRQIVFFRVWWCHRSTSNPCLCFGAKTSWGVV